MIGCMRTTLTLDDDVAVLLKRIMEKSRRRMRDVVNDALREGLARMAAPPRRSTRFHTTAASLGRCLVGDLDDVGEALAVAEEEDFR